MTKKQLYTMSFKKIKALEQMADGWLKANKNHLKFEEALRRYSLIVHIMNIKTPEPRGIVH